MSSHETLTDNPGLAFLLGPARPGFAGTWFGSVSIWSGAIIGFSAAGNAVVEVPVTGVPGVTAIQAEVFGVRTYDSTGLAQVDVTKIEWSLPGSADVIARYQFDNAVPFPLSVSRFAGDFRFVDILANGPTPTQLFDDYFQNSDTLVGAGAADFMRGGGAADILDGAGGADSLFGDQGNDTFIYRNGDGAVGETVDGGADTDHILAIGAAATGDIGQVGNVDISNLLISGLEEVWTNGTEVVITSAQLGPGGFTAFVGLNGARDMLTINNVSGGNFSGLNLTGWEAQDLVALLGTAATETVTGTGFADIFLGFGGLDTFNGGGGNDRFLILEGDLNPADHFNGDAGTDTLQLDASAVTEFDIGTKTDIRGMQLSSVETLDIVKGEYLIDAGILAGTLYGTIGAPVSGTGSVNRIIGNSTDTLSKSVLLEIRAGSALAVDLRTTVFENWNDGFYIDKLIRIVAGTQTTIIYTAANEENWVNGSGAAQGIYIFSGAQDDTLFGSYFADYVLGGAGIDYIYGLNGNDGLGGDAGNDWVWGGFGDDTVAGAAGADHLFGEDGNDLLSGGADIVEMAGGIGNDTYVVDNSQDVVIELAGGGADRVFTSVSYTLAAGQEIEVLATNSNTGTALINLTGNAFANGLTGNAAANVLNGGGGIDAMAGLGGNDAYAVDNALDAVTEAVGGGVDRVYASVSYTLAAGQEIETLSTSNNSGRAAINLTGNEFVNSLIGNLGANVLNGGGGIDTMTGLAGNDSYSVDNALDKVIEAASGGTDRVYASVSYVLAAGQEIETLSTSSNAGLSSINLTGNAFNNTLIGNGGANLLNGGLGNDILTGLNGADTFLFNTALNAVTNHDAITDFNISADTVQLENAVFTLLTMTGTLASAWFKDLSLAAQDANDIIIYDRATGDLFYDTNGLTAGGQTLFADVTNGTALTFADFVVV